MLIIYFYAKIKVEDIKNEVNSLLYILYNNYKEKYDNDNSSIKSSSMSTISSHFYKGVLEMFKSRKKNAITNSLNNTIDIYRYFSVETISFEDNEKFYILAWWKTQHIKYPVLYIIAHYVLINCVCKYSRIKSCF